MNKRIIFISLEYDKKENGIAIHVARKIGKGIRTYKYTWERSRKINNMTVGKKTVYYYGNEMIIYPYKDK